MREMRRIGGERITSFSAVRALAAIVLSLPILIIGASPEAAFAATGAPEILNYQGRLLDSSGDVLGGAGTNYCFKFSLYDNATVGSGTKLWPSGSPSIMTVPVTGGVFNVGIGDTNAGGDLLDYNFEDSDSVYLNVDVATLVGASCTDGEETFETLSPRQRILSSGFALNANTVGGFTAAQEATGNDIPVLESGTLVLGGSNAFLNATGTNALTFQGGGTATGDIRFFSSANHITSSGNATFAGSIAAASATLTNATTTNATSTTLAVTGTASTSNLVVSNGFTFGSLSGILKSIAGVVTSALVDLSTDVTGILPVGNGGTGLSSVAAGAVLYGNDEGALATTSAGIAGEVLTYLDGIPTWTATTTYAAPLSYVNGAVSIAKAGTSTDGYLSAADWSTFNGKVSSTSLSAAYPLSYNSSTGAFSSNFSTTSANTFGALQQFAAGASSTAASALDYVAVGRTATTTIRGESNATSTFAGGVQANAINVTGSATSTFAQGINLSSGCFSVNGTCVTGGGGTWGSITGTLSDQTDLQNALDGKLDASAWYATSTDGLKEGSSNLYFTTNRVASVLAGTTSDAIAEGSNNLYYTNSRVASVIAGTTTDALAEGATNQYFTNARVATYIDSSSTIPHAAGTSFGQLLGWGGSSWGSVATSSLAINTNDLVEGSNLFFTANRVASVLAGTTSDAIAEGATNKYFTNVRADARINATSSIGTLTSAPNLANVSTALNGIVKASAGALTAGNVDLGSEVSGTLPVASGGTGTSTAPSKGQVLLGNASGGYDLVSTSSLGISTNTTWGSITGTLSDQTDLQNALNAKFNLSDWYATSTDGLKEGSSNLYFTTNRVASVLAGTTSDAIAEGSNNLYYTNSRVASVIAGTTTDALAEGVTNQYFTNGRVQSYLDTLSKGYFFSTTSAAFWDSTQQRWATSSAAYFLSQNQGQAFSTSSANAFLATKSTDDIAQGVTNKYYSDAAVATYIDGSSTIPHTAGTSFGQLLSWNGSSWSTLSTSSLALTASAFASQNVSQWTNDAGYLTSLAGAASSTLLANNNTFSGTDTFTNAINGSVSGNAGTATKLATSHSINGVGFDGTGDITIAAASSSLLGDNNTFTGSLTFTKATTTSFAITGLANTLLSVNANGSVVATSTIGASEISGTLGIGQGGTGTSTAPSKGQVLLGNASGGYDLVSTSSLGIAANAAWGSITGTLSDQTDLQNALDGKLDASAWYATSTDGLKEGSSNLYFTNARVASVIAGTTTDALAEGATNQYFTNGRVATYIDSSSTIPHAAGTSFGQLLGWGGSSWGSVATSSLAINTNDLVEGSNLFFTANRVASVLAGTTSDAIAEGATNKYFTNVRADARINATSSIGTLTSAPNLANVSTALNGIVKASAGALTAGNVDLGSEVSGTLPVASGGTGTSTAPSKGQVLLGNASGGYNLVSTSSLGIAANASWGSITGTLSDQTDLQNALNAKFNLSDWYATTTDGLKEGSSNLYFTTNRVASVLAGTTSDAIAEGTNNLYYTNSRVASVIAGTTTDALAEGVTNQYFTNGRVQSYLDTLSKGYFFSTTSAAFWDSTQQRWATSSAAYFLSQNQGQAFSTSSANAFLSTKSTDDIAQGVTNKYYSDAAVATYIDGSSTIPHTAGTSFGQLLSWNGSSWSTLSTSSLALTASAFASQNVSQWTNDAGYLTSLAGAASSTLLANNNTFSGTDTFTNAINGSVSGNAGTATKLATSHSINGVGFDGTGDITIAAASSSLLGDNNTFTGSLTFTKATTTSFAITGLANTLLSVNANGSVVATSTIGASEISGTLGIGQGGTGTSTAPAQGQLLIGNGSGGYNYVATSSLGISTNTTWGSITGTLSDQTDLQNALNAKFNLSDWYATSTDGLKEGSSNLYFTTNRVASVLAGTTSDAIAEGTNNLYYTNSRVASVIAGTTTDALAEGATNQYFTNGRVATYIDSSSTIPHAAGTSFGQLLSWTGSAWGSVSTSSLGLPTFANIAGAYPFSGTGNSTSTITQFNAGLTALASSTIGNGAQAGGLTINGGATTTGNASIAGSLNVTGNTALGNATTTNLFSATASSTNLFSQLASLGTLTLKALSSSLLSVDSGGQVVATTSIGTNVLSGTVAVGQGGTGLASTPSFGQFLLGNGTGYTLTSTSSLGINTSDLVEGSNLFFTTNRVASVIAGTTTDALAEGVSNKYFTNARADARINATSSIGTLTSAPNLANISTALNGIVKASAGALTAGNVDLASEVSGLLPVGNGGTGLSSIASGALLIGNGTGALATTSVGSSLQVSGGSLGLNLGNANVWTGLQIFGNASSTAASALDYVAVGRTATTTIRGESNATSTFAGGVQANAINVTGSATSTFAQGIDLSSGCFSVNGTCVTGGSEGGPGSGVLVAIQTFSTAGTTTYTPSAGATSAQVIVTGAGGGGGAGATSLHGAGGGGAGGTAVAYIDLTSTSSVQVVVGAGGNGGSGAVGGSGNASSFSTFASATGGSGGQPGTAAENYAGGSGGDASGGAIDLSGGDGQAGGGTNATGESVGSGGSSYWGGGGGVSASGNNLNGNDGSAYGAGGGGSAGTGTGGNGASGVVVVYEYGPFNGVQTIANGGTGTSTAPGYGKVLVGDGSGGYTFVATSSLANVTWGSITGALSAQDDLQNALDGKLDVSAWYATTTDALAEGATNKYFTNARADARINATSSIGTLTAAPSLATVSTALTGILKATAGALSAGFVNLASDVTGVLPIGNGGTGTSTAPTQGELLVGNASGGYTPTATSSLGVDISDVTGVSQESQGGTGQNNYVLGDILYASAPGTLSRLSIGPPGDVLKVTGGIPQWGVDLTSGGGGGGNGLFSTTTNNLIIYPTDTTKVVTIGTNATSTPNSIFEVAGRSYFSNDVWIATTSAPGSLLSVGGVADFNSGGSTIYSDLLGLGNTTLQNTNVQALTAGAVGATSFGVGTTATTTIQGASTGTSTVQGFVNVLGTNSTSTFSGGLSVGGALKVSGAATSSFSSGLSIGGGLSVIGNATSTFQSFINVLGTNSTSTFSGGLSVGGALNVSGASASSFLNGLSVGGGLSVIGNASTTALSALNYISIGTTATTTLQGNSTGTSTIQGFLNVTGTNSTSTFSGNLGIGGGLSVTGSATSTFAKGINIASGCFSVNGSCIGQLVGLAGIFATSTETAAPGSNVAVTFTSSVTVPTWTGTALELPSTTVYYVVEMWGGGGGGVYTTAPTVNGGDSCYGTNATACTTPLMDAGGGVHAAGTATTATGGAGGTATGGNLDINGGEGQNASAIDAVGGNGGDSPRGGQGGTAPTASAASNAGNLPGGGGSGGKSATAADIGAGGGGGAYAEDLITNTTASHYTVGAAGPAGTGADVGGAGAAGGMVIYDYTSSATGADYAENYPTEDPGVSAGDIVSFDSSGSGEIKLAEQGDPALAGVVSTQPGEVIGDTGADAIDERPVALSGRVPVKVDLEGGPIAVGDRIALSATPGVGMKAGPFDDSVGIAMGSYDGTATSSEVQVFMDLQKGIDISALSLGLLGPDVFASSSTSTASSTSSTSPFDFVGGMIQAISSRLASLVTDTLSTNVLEPVDKTLQMKLQSDGSFEIERVGGSSTSLTFDSTSSPETLAVSIDANGNATFAGTLAAAGLTVGTSATPSGITMYDDSGAAYCAQIVDKALQAVPGACGSAAAASSTSQAGPIIEVEGSNPAHVKIGATYNDLGATITGPTQDLNLGIETLVDGTSTSDIALDTSTSTTYTITYRATDSAGNTSEATRTVIVGGDDGQGATDAPPASGSDTDTGASQTAPDDSASSTPPTPTQPASTPAPDTTPAATSTVEEGGSDGSQATSTQEDVPQTTSGDSGSSSSDSAASSTEQSS